MPDEGSMAVRSIGTAGWGIPRDMRESHPEHGTLLERYSAALCAVEINYIVLSPASAHDLTSAGEIACPLPFVSQ